VTCAIHVQQFSCSLKGNDSSSLISHCSHTSEILNALHLLPAETPEVFINIFNLAAKN